MNDDREVEFIPEKKEDSQIIIRLKNLWNDVVFYSTISYYCVKGCFMYFVTLGGVEIDVGYEENGKMHYYLQLEKIW